MGEECIQEAELRNLLEKKPNPIAYDGFEPSGRMHIAQVCIMACTSVALAELPGLLIWPAELNCSRCLRTAVRLIVTLQGVMKALNVNKLTKSGVTFKFW